MRLVIDQNISLDGVVELIDNWIAPEENDSAEINDKVRESMAKEDAMLLGRQTFKDFRGYWTKQTDDKTGITDHLNRVQKYVVSKTLQDPAWENTTVVSGDLLDYVRELKAQPGRNLGVTGSIKVCHALIEADLVDEYRLFVNPVVVGKGRRLFPDGYGVDKLRLVEATPFKSGVVLLNYARG